MRTVVFLFFGLGAGLGLVAYAEVVELEGKVRAVDADARMISIERKTAKGTKTTEFEAAKSAGDLSGFKEGDGVCFFYDPEVELITRFSEVDDAASPKTGAAVVAKKPKSSSRPAASQKPKPEQAALVGLWVDETSGWALECLPDNTARNLNPKGQVDTLGTWKDEGQGRYTASLGTWQWQIVVRGREFETVRYNNGTLNGSATMKRRR